MWLASARRHRADRPAAEGVIAAADLVRLDGDLSFQEAPVDEPPVLSEDLLAAVRDEDSWSWLACGPRRRRALPAVLFHFPPGVDNSGFVGWLACWLKRELGTGVVVVCGQNSRRGLRLLGLPAHLREQASGVLDELGAAPRGSQRTVR